MCSDTIEVFVEPGCPSCVRVVSLVKAFALKKRLKVRVYDRSRNPGVFLDRNVVVCPATFMNSRLAFYGEFSEKDLAKLMRSQPNTINSPNHLGG